jgi:toxin ParE1/3/4
MRVRISAEARRDLIAIGDFIARDNPRRAISFIKELTDKCAGLAAKCAARSLRIGIGPNHVS